MTRTELLETLTFRIQTEREESQEEIECNHRGVTGNGGATTDRGSREKPISGRKLSPVLRGLGSMRTENRILFFEDDFEKRHFNRVLEDS